MYHILLKIFTKLIKFLNNIVEGRFMEGVGVDWGYNLPRPEKRYFNEKLKNKNIWCITVEW